MAQRCKLCNGSFEPTSFPNNYGVTFCPFCGSMALVTERDLDAD